MFRALNRVSRFSEQIAPPQQTSRFARSKTLFHEVPYKDKEKNALCGMSLSRLYRETMRNCHFAFCNQKKKNWNFNKYYFSGNEGGIINMTS
ncbi:hypothetical protein HMPREF1592_03009 [Escherichia coli 907357]|nr:hypothetical protein HMPREF1592_03009 [Escherichia coli 907357]